MDAKLRIFLSTILTALVFDLGTKLWIDAHLSFTDRIPVIEGFFYITHVRNPGAAFGFLASAPAMFRNVFFLMATSMAIVMIFSLFRRLRPEEKLSAFSLGLVLGGALGNLTDRIFRGEVVDFLHFILWNNYAWPDFNVADSCIVVGVGLLILDLFASETETREQVHAAQHE